MRVAQAPSRRAALAIVAWTTPTVVVSVAAPAIAASSTRQPEHAGLNQNGSVRQDNVQANPRAWSYGNPGSFDPADKHMIRLMITTNGAASTSGHTISLIDPRTGTAAGETQLRGWRIVSATATLVVLEWPEFVSGSGFNTENVGWFFVELDASGAVVTKAASAAPGSVRVVGSITGTTIPTFDEGDLVGP